MFPEKDFGEATAGTDKGEAEVRLSRDTTDVSRFTEFFVRMAALASPNRTTRSAFRLDRINISPTKK